MVNIEKKKKKIIIMLLGSYLSKYELNFKAICRYICMFSFKNYEKNGLWILYEKKVHI